MATVGYSAGQPFGDPNQFTRGTGEAELDRFNQWMRSQPFWQQARALNPAGDMTDAQRRMIEQGLQSLGVTLPGSFVVDRGGNLNQENRLDDTLKWSAIGGGALLGGLGLAGMGPLGGSLGGIFGGGAGAGAAGAGGVSAGTQAALAGIPELSSLATMGTMEAIGGSTLPATFFTGLGTLPSASSSLGPAATAAAGGTAAGNAVNRIAQQAAGGTGGFDWLDLLKVAGPLGGLITSQALDRGNQRPQLDPALVAQMQELVGLQTERARASAPVHAAAMQMAQRMANTGANSPRLNQTIQNVSRPMGAPTTDPAVLAAISRLAGG